MAINLSLVLYMLCFTAIAALAVAIVEYDYRRMTYVVATSNRYVVRRNNAVDRHERRIDAIVKRAVSLMQQGNVASAMRVLRPNDVVRQGSAKANPFAKAFDLKALFKADNKGVFGKTVAGNTAHYDMRLWKYGFMQDVPEWKMASAPLTEKNDGMATLRGMLNSNPALAWMKDDKAVALFVKGTNTEAFLALKGVAIRMGKGIGPVSKRISRVLRPSSLFINTIETAVRIKYVRRGIVRMLSQDGAGWVSSAYLMHMAEMRIKDEALNDDEAAALRNEARKARRVDYTILDRQGEWKGNMKVVRTNKWDIKLIDGQVKPDLYRTDDRVYISFQVQHASPLFLDVQSAINLGKFFESKLVGWAHEYLQSYLDKLSSGKAIDAILTQATRAKFEGQAYKMLDFPLFNAVVSGLDPRWFKHTTKQFLALGLKHIEARQRNMAFPLPGINLYVMPASVSDDHRIAKLQRGHVWVDVEGATLWVNDVDLVTSDQTFAKVFDLELHLAGSHTLLNTPVSEWMQEQRDAADARLAKLQAAAPGLMIKWGGSDDDDMLRVFQFVDFDGVKKCLLWRSPNKLGEFAVLNFGGGDDLEWVNGAKWLAMDSRNLLTADLWESTKYLNLVQPYEGEKPKEYSIAVIAKAADQMLTSVGAVGIHCLDLWFVVGVLGKLADKVSDTVESFIDAAVKTFDDCSIAVAYDRKQLLWLAEQSMTDGGKPIPACRAQEFERLVTSYDEDGNKIVAPFRMAKPGECWIDELYAGLKSEIAWYKAEVENAGNAARPPAQLYVDGLKFADAGRRFKAVWGSYWHDLLGDQVVEDVDTLSAFDSLVQDASVLAWSHDDDEAREENFDNVRQTCEEYISQFPEEMRPMVMLGGLADLYAKMLVVDGDAFAEGDERVVRDSAFWQMGESLGEGMGRKEGFGDLTIKALRQIGLIGTPEWTENGIVVVQQREAMADAIILDARAVWFNLGKALKRIPVNFTFADVNALSKRETAAHKQTTESYCKNAAAKLDLTGKVFDVDVVEITVRKQKMDIPGLFSVDTGNMLCSLGKGTHVNALPARVSVLSNRVASEDHMWLICEAA